MLKDCFCGVKAELNGFLYHFPIAGVVERKGGVYGV
jgi:hypothetical protein